LTNGGKRLVEFGKTPKMDIFWLYRKVTLTP
jgi:hypothetical protein